MVDKTINPNKLEMKGVREKENLSFIQVEHEHCSDYKAFIQKLKSIEKK